jgi:hypothetical protein
MIKNYRWNGNTALLVRARGLRIACCVFAPLLLPKCELDGLSGPLVLAVDMLVVSKLQPCPALTRALAPGPKKVLVVALDTWLVGIRSKKRAEKATLHARNH